VKLELRDSRRGRGARRDAFVVFASAGEGKADPLETVAAEVRAKAAAAAPAEPGAEGSLFTVPLPRPGPAARLYVFGVGKNREMSPRKAREFLRTVLKTLHRNGETSAILDFPFALQRMGPAESREFLLRTLLVGDYVFRRYKSGEMEKRPLKTVAWNPRGAWQGVRPSEAARELKEATAVAQVAALMRDLGNTPANDLRPRDFAERARKEARARRVKVKVLDKKAIARERMGGLLAVSRGSAEEPRLVVLEHSGGRKGAAPVALVGKGVTFDSGGISIKPAEKMGEMKWDMMGAATVLGVVLAAAQLKLGVNLVGVAALTENLPSGSAYKPGDIVRFRNGKTAEIDNTDAEGRVILADALDYALEWKPAVLIDYATLTGAALVALGLEAAIVFSDDDDLAKALVASGERTDERLWRLPMWEDYKENIRSEWADVKNTGGRWGGSINGAMFLKEFVDAKTPWAHLDIAPTAYYERDHAGYAIGATAFGLAMTLRWLKDRLKAKKKGTRGG
jgi:leucyl aminopeptidase